MTTTIPTSLLAGVEDLTALAAPHYQPVTVAMATFEVHEGTASPVLALRFGAEHSFNEVILVLERTNDDGDYQPQLYLLGYGVDANDRAAVLAVASGITNRNEDALRIQLGGYLGEELPPEACGAATELVGQLLYGYRDWANSAFRRPLGLVGDHMVLEP